MTEIDQDINKKTRILLSRNQPVALVVEASHFLGSQLVDKLLEKGLQVMGVDQWEEGNKRNLLKASQSSHFHMVSASPDQLEVELPRLDYIFIVSAEKWNLDKILELFKKFNCRCLLVSSIGLYQKELAGQSKHLKSTESKLAKFAQEFKLNARILRLGPVYGPRMDFTSQDPLVKLLQQTLTDDLQKDYQLEFSSRALYVDDAVDLMIRTIFAGSTSQKIFDGISPAPVQVSEVKQILLDPLWYENRNFTPQPLPPWPTPNLEKTIKFLNWQPKQKLVASLRETLSYFKDNEIEIPKAEFKVKEEKEWDDDKKKELELFKIEPKPKQGAALPKFSLPWPKIYLILVVFLALYALIWPGLVLGWGVFTFRYQLDQGIKNLQAGEFERSLENMDQAERGALAVKDVIDSLEPARVGFLANAGGMDSFVEVSLLSAKSAKSASLGMQALFEGVKAVTGEKEQSPLEYFSLAQVELASASLNLSKLKAKNVGGKLAGYDNLISRAQVMSILLPKLVAVQGKKDYLILLQNNMELRPGGGFIGSFARLSFEGGKLKKLGVNDIYNIDGQLSIHVEPPKEIKEDLGQNNWYLRDSNWEPDFPTAARQAEWFYTKETGERVEGTIALDISAMEQLLAAIGAVDLSDYKEKITSDNLFEKAVSYAETSFFPGSQAKKSFITALTHGVFNKIFFLPQNNWPAIISALGKSLDEGHISIYLDDPKLFSYIANQNWARVFPRQSDQNKNQDFLSLVEANMGANKANYYLNRNINLETIIGKDGGLKHRLRISYTNRSPSDAFPGGKYKNRMRVYLPFGSKLTKASWGEADITKNVTSFVDYGRSGFSMLLELNPKEQKNLVLDYSVPVNLKFEDNKATYRLDIIKQAGTLADPLNWTITYPISYQIAFSQAEVIGPQEQTIQTDLSRDRSFEVEFKK